MKISTSPIKFGISTEVTNCLALLHATEDEAELLLPSLNPIEKNIFDTYQHPLRKKSYLWGRYCAKQAVCGLIPNLSPSSVSIISSTLRHPIVRGLSQNGICISLAHSQNHALALAYFDTNSCGVDIESVNYLPKETVLSLLTEKEQGILVQNSLTEEEKFALFWCAKESLSKALKTGLTLPYSFFEILSIENKHPYYQVSYTHFSQYSSINFILDGMMISIAKPKTLEIYGLSL